MYRELELIRRGMIVNITLEELIGDLADDRAQTMMPVLEGLSSRLTEWNEEIMYQLLEKVTVLSRVRIRVTLRDGQEIEQAVNQPKRRVVV